MTAPTLVTRYTWTTTGLTPNFDGHGAMSYVRETDYEQLERDLAARDAELRYVRETLDKALPGMDEGAPIEAIARKVAAHIAAREAELAELMKWKEAVINELIVAHIYSQVHDDSPRKAVHDAITWHCQVEIDPAVSSDARKLRDTYLQRAEAAEMRLKLYEPIHTFNGLTIEEWKRKAEAAERDAFTMAAGQCIVKSGGLMADDHGHQYCDMERQRDEWKRKAEEAARDADAAAIYGNTGRAHGFVGIPKWSELAEETRNLYREALAARAAIAAKGEA